MTSKSFPVKKIMPGIYSGMSNQEYHEQLHHSCHYFSSSQVKDAMGGFQVFRDKYILGLIDKKESSAFDVGNYYHTAILEPHLLGEQYAIWPGEARRGPEYERFKIANEGKVILSKNDLVAAENCVQATLKSELCMLYIDDPQTEVEVSFFTEIDGIKRKARTDILRLGKENSYVLDLKSCTGDVRDVVSIRKKIHMMDYEMSAAYYMEIINKVLIDTGWDGALVTDWYWVFASKDLKQAQLWKATKDMLEVGKSKCRHGLANIQEGFRTNWQIQEKLMVVDAYITEKQEWIKK